MFDPYRDEIKDRFRSALLSLFGEPLPPLVWNQPPKIELGDMASPVAYELAKRVKRAPAEIAKELVRAAEPLPGVRRVEVAGGGYINLFLDRRAYVAAALRQIGGRAPSTDIAGRKNIIEHTNINPNKAAHVGHLRNAVIGDTLGRAFRYLGEPVEIQNYIDDTGVQVADAIVGLRRLRSIDSGGLDSIPGRFDYYLWDLYSEVTRKYEQDPDLVEERRKVLHDLEAGEGENARLAHTVTDRIVRHHLETMRRINVSYDLLVWEGNILAEKFWEKTFRRLQETGTAYRPTEGRHQGCWVMRIRDGAEGEKEEEAEKVLVRSDGTVTYIGKDIAYQLWKFGLLDAEFQYRPFLRYPDGRGLWSTGRSADGDAPAFGHGRVIYNVIDSRQSRLQRLVAEGLRALGHAAEADRSIHFSYEMVTLSRACAEELGFKLDAAEADSERVNIAGRKGQGIKADDLLDTMMDKAGAEVAKRNPEFTAEEIRSTASIIAVGALRYFMIKFNRNRVITFDFQDALSFEGETGPYLQYSVVRASNILRKIEDRDGRKPEDLPAALDAADWTFLDDSDEGNAFWEILHLGTRWRERVRTAIDTLELSTLARACFQRAQKFNAYYHRYPVLQENDPGRRLARMLLVFLFREQMREALGVLGVEVPERM
jgi:arginyl-tRNA synthetase